MAFPTSLNSMITDEVVAVNNAIVDKAPAVAVAQAIHAMAHSVGLAMANAVTAQQQGTVTSQAATTMAATRALGNMPTKSADA